MNIGNWIADHNGLFEVLSYVAGGTAAYMLVVTFVLYRLALRNEARDQAQRNRLIRNQRAATTSASLSGGHQAL